MRREKIVLSLILAVLLCLSLVPVSALAEEAVPEEELPVEELAAEEEIAEERTPEEAPKELASAGEIATKEEKNESMEKTVDSAAIDEKPKEKTEENRLDKLTEHDGVESEPIHVEDKSVAEVYDSECITFDGIVGSYSYYDSIRLYKPILDMFYENISNQWRGVTWDRSSTNALDPSSASYMFGPEAYFLKSLDEVGFAFFDLNYDGSPELLVTAKEAAKYGMIYDAYTIVDGNYEHILSSGERYRYCLAGDNLLIFSGSNSAWSGAWAVYRLSGGSSRLSVVHYVDIDYSRSNTYTYTSTGYQSDVAKGTIPLTAISDATAESLFQSYSEKPFDITLFSSYEPNPLYTQNYTVTYNANGGTGAPAAQTKTQGFTLTLSSTKPTRSGYTFQGWATRSTATTAQYQPGKGYTNDADVTLYAVWKANETKPVADIAISGDGMTATVTGDFSKLYARVALVLDNNGSSGLYITQATINTDGTIVMPSFMVPGLKVKGVNVALVPTLGDISSATPDVEVSDFKML